MCIRDRVKVAHAMGLSLEAEVGSIGGEEDGVVGLGECADPQECKAIADLGIDFLAAGIGNIHGKYPENWPGLRFDVLEQVKAAVGDMPLVPVSYTHLDVYKRQGHGQPGLSGDGPYILHVPQPAEG